MDSLCVKVVLFVVYIVIVGCVIFGLFTVPWYAVVNASMHKTHTIEPVGQNRCLLWATLVGYLIFVVSSTIIYYVLMHSKMTRISEDC